MIELPARRISGLPLRLLVKAVRHLPVRRVVVDAFRSQLGIEAVLALGDDLRGPLPIDLLPVRARAVHSRPSEQLGIPEPAAWPQARSTYARHYRDGKLRPEQVVARAFELSRELAARRPSMGPLLAHDEERARRAAKQSGDRYAARQSLSPLDGVPIAIKEEVDVAGLPTRLGTSFLPDTPAAADCAVVARLRAAGAIILGQTAMTEYGMSPLGGNVHRTMPRNPHDPTRLPGGSSSGSGVAVAVGLCPLALGADGGGSIRIPAALNGVFGLKPTFGRIPLAGHGLPAGSSVVHLGPIGASAEDLAIFVELGSGADPRDPASMPQPPLASGELVAALGRGVRGLRIGIEEDEWSAAPDDLSRPLRDALRELERAGAVLVRVQSRLARHASAIGYLTIGLETLSALHCVREEHRDRLGLDLQLLLANMELYRSDDYISAQRVRSALRTEIAGILRDVDVLALPTTACAAPPVSDEEARDGFIDPEALEQVCRYSFLGNLTGLPAGTAPVAHDGALPLGLQIVGDAWDEATVLQVLAHLERIGAAHPLRPAVSVDIFGS
jgi:Asp-tRNA(Asn)/Glu-tRNA(Gln) amidotransferase A subunit family amidase